MFQHTLDGPLYRITKDMIEGKGCDKKTIREGERFCRYLLANGGCTKRDEIVCVEFTDDEIRQMKCSECGSMNIRWNGQSTVCLDCENEVTGPRIIPRQAYEVAP